MITFVSVFSIKYVVWSVFQPLLFCFALFLFLFAVALDHCLQLCLAAVLIMSDLAKNFCSFNFCLKRKALAKRSRNWTQVDNLGLLATPFGQALRALALTCDDLRSLWSRSNLHASRSKFFTVWPPNTSQRKLNDVH